jgi:hypothetical protein
LLLFTISFLFHAIEGVPELELSEIKRSGKSADAVPALWLAVREKRSSNF